MKTLSFAIEVNLDAKNALEDTEIMLIKSVIKHTRGNLKAAAELLGVSRSAIYAKIKRYAINFEREDGYRGIELGPRCPNCRGYGHAPEVCPTKKQEVANS